MLSVHQARSAALGMEVATQQKNIVRKGERHAEEKTCSETVLVIVHRKQVKWIKSQFQAPFPVVLNWTQARPPELFISSG